MSHTQTGKQNPRPDQPRQEQKPLTTPAESPSSKRSEGQEAFRRIAHQRLDELMNHAENQKLWGRVGIEVVTERGNILHIDHTFKGSDRNVQS